MFYFLKIYIYKNTKNCYQYRSILTILFYFFFFESDGLKINLFLKWKKYPGDIIILHKCTTNQNRMISISQDTGCDEWIFFFVILDQFFHFALKIAWRIKFEKMKRTPVLFYTCVTKIMIWLFYSSWDKEQDRQRCLSFWAILCSFTPSPKNSKNQNFEKIKKIQEISLCYTCVPKIKMIRSTVPEICSLTGWNWQCWIIFCPLTHFKWV